MWLWVAVALAGKADGLQKMLDVGRIEDAQKKCERSNAWLSETDPAVREVCAEAMWARAIEADSFAGWVRFQTDWAGTQKAKAAFDMEAVARLRDIGPDASKSSYLGFLKKYGDTTAAPDARALVAKAAIAEVDSAESAKKVARDYPDADGLIDVVRRYFDAFVQLEIDGESIAVSLDPPVRLPGALLSAEWGLSRSNGFQPWLSAAAGHLDEIHIPRPTAESLKRKEEGVLAYPPCDLPGEELGVLVKYGDLESFMPQSRPCGGTDPAFVSVREGALVGLTLRAGVDYRFASTRDSQIEWVNEGSRVNIPLLGIAEGDVMVVGPVIGQKIGRTWLLHPLAGGLPWYVLDGPPSSALRLPNDPVSVPLPKDIRIVTTEQGDARLERGDATQWTRSLPAGSVRVWSPLFQEISGLHNQNPAFKRVASDGLPSGFVPDGKAPVELEANRRLEIEQELGDFRVQLTRAWQVQLGPDPKLEIVFEGHAGGRPVKGLVDPKEGSAAIRVFLFENTEGSPQEVVLFRHQGRTWFGWKSQAHLESLHYDGRGLVRTWTASP